MAKYESKTTEGKCIFCEIAQGKTKPLGNGLIWESKNYMAWLSPFPNTEGFTVVIPKKHYSSDVLAMSDDEICRFIIEAKKVAKVLINFFDDVGRVGLMMEGMGVDHAHIKLFPMHGTGSFKKGEWVQMVGGSSAYFDKYPGYIISNDGPKADFSRLEQLAKKIRES